MLWENRGFYGGLLYTKSLRFYWLFFLDFFFLNAGMCTDFYYVEDIKKIEKVANTIPSLWTDNGGVNCNRISPG